MNGRPDTEERLRELLRRRIMIIDGAMGTMLQRCGFEEPAYRGKRFVGWSHHLKGNFDVLSLTHPEVIAAVHRQYLEAGADIIETNTFNSQALSLADYSLQTFAYELNHASAKLARGVRDQFRNERPDRECFVAGALGPTNRTASLSPDVDNPAFRAVSFDELVAAYYDQTRGLVDGGVDLLLVETVFDTLNSKAALFAIEKYFDVVGRRLPVMVSFTITDLSGRTLSGQTVEAYWNSVSHMDLLSIGINCALGPNLGYEPAIAAGGSERS